VINPKPVLQPNTHLVARVENSSSVSMMANARSGVNSTSTFCRMNSAVRAGAIGWYLAR